MSQVIDKILEKYPQYRDVPWEQLVSRIAEKYPQYLYHDDFRQEVAQVKQQQAGQGVQPFAGERQMPFQLGTFAPSQAAPVAAHDPRMAAMAVTQMGPVIASQMQPGIGKFLVEQANAQNMLLGKVIPAAWNIPVLGNIMRLGLGVQGVKSGAESLGTLAGSPDATSGEKRYLGAQAVGGALQGLMTPKVGPLAAKAAIGVPHLYADMVRDIAGSVKEQGPAPRLGGKPTPQPVAPISREQMIADTRRMTDAELQQGYEQVQGVTRNLIQQGNFQAAAIAGTRGQFMREEMQRRTSESSQKPPVPTPTPPKTQELTQPASLTFKPAIKVGDEVHSVEGHQTAPAQRAVLANPGKPVLRGFLGSDNKFYNTLEAARVLAQQKEQNASRESSTTGVSIRQQGAGVGEKTPLRQQGQVAQASQEEKPTAPSTGGGVQAPGLQRTGSGEPRASDVKGAPGGVLATVPTDVSKLPQQTVRRRIIPAVKVGDKTLVGPQGWTHNDILKANKLGEDVGERGFVVGKHFLSREQAAQVTGLETKVEPGKLHSEDLPGFVQKVNKTGEGGWVLFPTGEVRGNEMLGFKKGTPIDKDQMYNRLRNSIGAESSEWKWWEQAGLKNFLSQNRSVDELQKWMTENGPKAEVHSYGMEGKVSEAKREYDKMTHDWFDTLPANLKNVVRDLNQEIITPHNTVESVIADHPRSGDKPLNMDFVSKAKKYRELYHKYKAEPRDTSPRATSYYDTISPFDTHEPMPEWTTSKEGRNVQRVDVVVPYNKKVAESSGYDIDTDPEDIPRSERQEYLEAKKKGNVLWQPDNLHENLPNTLGWAMIQYKTGPKGEKIAVVTEVQSRWGQEIRARKEEYKQWQERTGGVPREGIVNDHPLLRDYNRLILKAAIEQARKEGATHIAISDAETAMMTEGHDAAAPWTYVLENPKTGQRVEAQYEGSTRAGSIEQLQEAGWKTIRKYQKPEQEPGMRLNYDTVLPKIAEELTGSKGEKVSLGEHKNAYMSELDRPDNDPTGKPPVRDNLIFHNPDGTPKLDVTARLYPIDKAAKEMSMFGKDKPSTPVPQKWSGESGAVNVKVVIDTLKNVGTDVKDFLKSAGSPEAKGFWDSLRGKELPRTSAVDQGVANKLYSYAQANAVSDVLKHTDPTAVLGKHYNDPVFDRKLGAVLTEYNLRATGNTTIGKPWSPFKSDADYQAALKDPEVQAAIDRHAQIVLAPAEQRHVDLGGKKIELPDPKMFVNLKYKPATPVGGNLPRGGLLKATLQRKARFTQERKGTADEYELSYRALAERMVKANYAEALRKQLNDAYVAKGLGWYVKAGDAIPDNATEIPVRVQRAVIIPEGESPSVVNQNRSLYIRKDLVPEYLQTMQAQIHGPSSPLRKMAEVLTKMQVSLGVDAVQHTVNMASAVNGAVRAELGKNVIGVKEADTIGRIAENVVKVQQDTPEIQALLGEMARKYGIAREQHTYEGLISKEPLGGKVIQTIDKAGRVTLFQIAQELAKAGFIKNDPVEIRKFVNSQLGQYNTRLMSSFEQFAKATFSPFIVAGKTFNRLAVSRLLLSPQVKAANPKAWAQMRARQAFYVASAAVLIPAVVNYYNTGSVYGSPGTRFGELDLGNDRKFDMLKWTLLRRGARITGLQTFGEQQIMPRLQGGEAAPLEQTARQMSGDIARGVVAPYAGPPVNAASVLARGKTLLGFEAREPGEKAPYIKAAIRQLNPMIGSMMEGSSSGHAMTEGPVKRLAQVAGYREAKPVSVIRQLARQFNYAQGKASETDFPPSEYLPLLNALEDGHIDAAKKLAASLKDEKTEKTLEQYFKNYPNKFFTGNKEREKEFVAKLTPHQKDLYEQARQHQEEIAKAFFEQVLGKPVPSKGDKGFGSFGSFKFKGF